MYNLYIAYQMLHANEKRGADGPEKRCSITFSEHSRSEKGEAALTDATGRKLTRNSQWPCLMPHAWYEGRLKNWS